MKSVAVIMLRSLGLALVLFCGVVSSQRCRFSDDELPDKFAKFVEDCLDKGFHDSTMDMCKSTVEKKMRKKNSITRCRNLDQYLERCGMHCEDLAYKGGILIENLFSVSLFDLC